MYIGVAESTMEDSGLVEVGDRRCGIWWYFTLFFTLGANWCWLQGLVSVGLCTHNITFL